MEEKIIKENIFLLLKKEKKYPFLDYTPIGCLRLTKSKLIFNYYLFGIPITNNKACGIFKRKIEISLQNIKEAQHHSWGALSVSYSDNLQIKKLYLTPNIILNPLSFVLHKSMGGYLLEVCEEWAEIINKVIQ